MRKIAVFSLCAIALVGVVGCPGLIGPPASAILAGDWTGTDADGVVVTVTFDDNGVVVSVAREDGATAVVSNSTTDLVGDAVTIVIGGRTFSGTLSADQNTIAGTIDQEITAGGGDVVITIPAGDFEINRVVDPCDGNTCDDGDACNGVETCDADTGDCVDGTPVECAEGETCVDGECVPATDPCDGNTCDDGDACNGVETCDADTGECVDGTPVECAEGETCDPATGECAAADPCDGVECADCEECVDGACVPLVGDAAAGETYYSSSEGGCFNCHGPDGEGPPSVIGADCSLIFDELTVEGSHAGGTRDITGQDAADLEAWLAP